jgi:hypothetical protein
LMNLFKQSKLQEENLIQKTHKFMGSEKTFGVSQIQLSQESKYQQEMAEARKLLGVSSQSTRDDNNGAWILDRRRVALCLFCLARRRVGRFKLAMRRGLKMYVSNADVVRMCREARSRRRSHKRALSLSSPRLLTTLRKPCT